MSPTPDKEDVSKLTEAQAESLDTFRATLEAIGSSQPDADVSIRARWNEAQAQFSDLMQSLAQSNVQIVPRDEQSYRKASDEDRTLMALDAFRVGLPVVRGVSEADRVKAIRYLCAVSYCGSLTNDETRDVRTATQANKAPLAIRDTQAEGRAFFNTLDADTLSPVDKMSLTAATSVEPIAKLSIASKSADMKKQVEEFNALVASAKAEASGGAGLSQDSVEALKKFVFGHTERTFMAAATSVGLPEDKAKITKSTFGNMLRLFKLSPRPPAELLQRALNGETISRNDIGSVHESKQVANQKKSEERAAAKSSNRRRSSGGSGEHMTPNETNPAPEPKATAPKPAADPVSIDQTTKPNARDTVASIEGVGSDNAQPEESVREGGSGDVRQKTAEDIATQIKNMSSADRETLFGQTLIQAVQEIGSSKSIQEERIALLSALSQYQYQNPRLNQVAGQFRQNFASNELKEQGVIAFFSKIGLISEKTQEQDHEGQASGAPQNSEAEQRAAAEREDTIAGAYSQIDKSLRDPNGNLTGTGRVVTEWLNGVKDNFDRANLVNRESRENAEGARSNELTAQGATNSPGSVGFMQGISNMVGGVTSAIGRISDFASRKISGANRPQNEAERLARNTLAFESATHSASAAYSELADVHHRLSGNIAQAGKNMHDLLVANATLEEGHNYLDCKAAHVFKGLSYDQDNQPAILHHIQQAEKAGTLDSLPESYKPAIERYNALAPEEKKEVSDNLLLQERIYAQSEALKHEVGKNRDAITSDLSGYAKAIDDLGERSTLSETQMDSLREQAEEFKDRALEIDKIVKENKMTEGPEVEAKRQAALQKALDSLMKALEKIMEKIRNMFRGGPSRGGPAPS